MKIQDYLKKQKLILDGAMGTYYARLTDKENALSEYGNLTEPDTIIKIHQEYIAAGAGIIRTNTFAANRQVLQISKEEQVHLITAACRLAREAVEGSGKAVYIAGDIGPIPDNWGQLTNVSEEEIMEEYYLICDTFLKENPEIILFETFPDFRYINRLLPYIREKAPDCFIMTNFCLNKNGYTGSGISAAAILEEIACNRYIDAGGFNCGIGSGHMYQILKKLNFPNNKYIIAAPNAGYPEQFQNRMVFLDNEVYFASNMKRIAGLGMDIIGGCCGTAPGYIRTVAKQTETGIKTKENRMDYSRSRTEQKELRKNEFYELFSTGKKVVAVELDPPYDARDEKLIACAYRLKELGTDMITMADSPMGRSRADSTLMSVKLFHETGMSMMPHICCRDKNMIAMRSGLLGAYANGIRNLLIVTGDPIPSESRLSTTGVFDYNSIRLMEFVQAMNREHFREEPFYFGGALNYNRGNIEGVIERMRKKIAAGAKYFLTQPVFSEEDIEKIKEIRSKVDTRILCGIMPLTSYRNAVFIKNEISGIHVPDEVVEKYRPDMTKEEAEWTGAGIAGDIIEKLSPVADGYYFMLPFNRVSFMEKIKIK